MRIYGIQTYIKKSTLASAAPAGEYVSTGPAPRKILKGKNPKLVRKAGESTSK